MNIRKAISKLGRGKTVALITAISLLISVMLTLVFIQLLVTDNIATSRRIGLTIAISVPLLVAPISSWYLVGLLLEIHDLEEKMRALATYDDLTGLLTRKVFLERAQQLLKLVKRTGQALSFLLVDIDDFKQINDKYGHAAGDKALMLFGHAIASISRESDMACRFGGEEFAFCLPNTSGEQAMIFSERLHRITRETLINYDDKSLIYTISIGIASYPDINTENSDDILNAADNALYNAKRVGKNQTQIYKAEGLKGM